MSAPSGAVAIDSIAPRERSDARGRSSRRTALLLFLACLAVYNVNLREISSQDTMPTRLLPAAVIQEHRLTLDRFFEDYPAEQPLPYWARKVDGHYVSLYPVLPALLAVPVYLVPVSLLGSDSWALINGLAKLSASLVAAVSVVVLYLGLRRLTAEPAALGATLVYAFGTSTWSVSSQGLWSHGAAQLFMTVALYCLLRGSAETRFFEGVGAAAGLMVASRPQMALVAAALLAYVVHRDWRRGVRGLVWGAAVLTPIVLDNLWRFGSIQGGYARLLAFQAEHDRVAGMWLASWWEGLPGLLVSPSRGLFVYSPVLLFSLVGLGVALGRRRDALYAYLAGGLVGTVLVLSRFSAWWGGDSFGPRLLTDLAPLLVVFLVPAWERLATVRSARAVFVGLFALSVVVQSVGVFYYPSPRGVDWNTSPVPIGLAQERLWDWRDTQLLRLLRNGPSRPGFGSLG